MFARAFGWGALFLGLVLGLGLLALGGDAVAQEIAAVGPSDYVGYQICGACHLDQYESYINHGHATMLVQTTGQTPPADLYPWGVPLPTLPTGKTWSDIEYIVGNFRSGTGRFVGLDGKYINANGTTGSNYSCARCHTTGYNATGHQVNHLGVEMPGAVGTWALNNIQCEVCHGPGGTMAASPTVKPCQACHGSGEPQGRLQFNPATGFFPNRSGDEFDHSPHKSKTCSLCHDPHRSVWHGDGGVRYAEDEEEVGHMCAACHQKTHRDFPSLKKVRVRGAMGELGLECIECHMPYASHNGAGAAHVFRISTDPIAAADNATYDEVAKKWWWNKNQDGNSFLTLDMVCAECHESMTLEQMSKAAKTIHRTTEMLDLTVNGDDRLQVLKNTDVVSVAFSVECGDKEGVKADWWVICQGPRGWTYWDGKKWKRGLRPWRKQVALADVPDKPVFTSRLNPGYYTYWVGLDLADGSENFVSVPLSVTKAPKPPRRTARR